MIKKVCQTIKLIVNTMARAGEFEAHAYRVASRSSRPNVN